MNVSTKWSRPRSLEDIRCWPDEGARAAGARSGDGRQDLVHVRFGEDLDGGGPYVSPGCERENPFRHRLVRHGLDREDQVAGSHREIAGLKFDTELLAQLPRGSPALRRILDGSDALVGEVAE